MDNALPPLFSSNCPTREIAWKRFFSEAMRPPIYCRPSALVLALAIQRSNDSNKDLVIWAIRVILNRLVVSTFVDLLQFQHLVPMR